MTEPKYHSLTDIADAIRPKQGLAIFHVKIESYGDGTNEFEVSAWPGDGGKRREDFTTVESAVAHCQLQRFNPAYHERTARVLIPDAIEEPTE